MKTIVIPTTQHIELEFPVANVGERIVAGLVDFLILVVYFYLLSRLMSLFYVEGSWSEYVEQHQAVSLLLSLPALTYSLWCEILFNGKTLGKHLLNLRTIRLDGASAQVSNYLIRWMLRLVDVWLVFSIPIIGIISIASTKKGQRLGDFAAGTTVVKMRLVTTFGDTIFRETHENYHVVFPQIQSLSDRDVSILKEVLDAGVKSDNPELLRKLAHKICAVTGIETKMSARTFLETILKDYNHVYGGN
ncbi:MAG: RDD family protein [Bacteroidota bacterium]